ncbi:MAG: DUF561 domain-containing protein [Chloroflexota bacterium]
MWYQTPFTDLAHITYPVIQAPMAGGATPPELVAVVSNGGGLGSLGAGYMSPQQIQGAIQSIRALTDRPFAVNIFIPEANAADSAQIAASHTLLQPYREALSIAAPPEAAVYTESFEEQMSIILAERVPIVSFTFGGLPSVWIERLKTIGTVIMGTATTVREAMALEQAGVDVVVAQGSEAGGHRGTFLGPAEEALIGTMALIPQIVDAVRVPVIAAGGIMDGRGLVAALVLGASGVQMGTAFLTCSESGVSSLHKAALRENTEDMTMITRAFSGKAARGIRNRFSTELYPYEDQLPQYPVQNTLTQDIRKAASKQGRPEFMSLWAGQGLRLIQDRSAADLIDEIIAQGATLRDRFTQ